MPIRTPNIRIRVERAAGYDNFVECIEEINNEYRLALKLADNAFDECQEKCFWQAMLVGAGCVASSLITRGSLAVLCLIADGAYRASYMVNCRVDRKAAYKDAACIADEAIGDCIKKWETHRTNTPTRQACPLSSGLIRTIAKKPMISKNTGGD